MSACIELIAFVLAYTHSALCSETKHIQEFARTRVGIDAYTWLHRGTFSCAIDICRGNETKAYVDYCVYRIRMLLHFNVTPVLVFDGADLPMKADTHAERRSVREKALADAEAAYARGDRSKAAQFYQRACPVTSEMARHVIRQCRQMNIEYVVAPFEADAQLAWMMHVGYVDSIITEDSDLLVYGTSRIFFKMNRDGHGDLFQRKNLPSLEKISLSNFTDDMIVYMCVCAGCDFFKGVHGLGILKAHSVVRRYRTMSRIMHAIRVDSKYRVSKTFTSDFARACLVFRHQTVFDIRTGQTVPLYPLTDSFIASLPNGVIMNNDKGAPDLTFLGRHLDPSVAKLVAKGFVHPRSLVEYDEPLDLVERPLSIARPNSAPPQYGRTTAQSRPPSGFQVAGTPASSGKPLQKSLMSIPPPKSPHSSVIRGQLRSAPNLKQRLTSLKSRTGGTSIFNPLREAQKFRVGKRSLTPEDNRSSSPLKVRSKFQVESCSMDSSPGIGCSGTGIKPDSGTTEEHVNSPSMLDDGPQRSASKLGLTTQADENQDAPAVKRPRHLPPSVSKADAVLRVVSKFSTVPPGSTVEFQDKNVRPPSPDHDSFELFDRIDEFSRDGPNLDSQSRACQKPLFEKSERKMNPAPTSLNRSKSFSTSDVKPKLDTLKESKRQLRVSRFFASSQSGTMTKAKSHSVRESKSGLKLTQAQRSICERSGRDSKVQIDNLRRGASGSKIVSVPVAPTAPSDDS